MRTSARTRLALAALGVLAGVAAAELALQTASLVVRLAEGARRRVGRGDGDLTILCLGESTTAPAGVIDHSWPRQLQEILSHRLPGRRVTVINEGHNSSTTGLLLEHLEKRLRTDRPDIVIAMMGRNDEQWYGVRPGSRGLERWLCLPRAARYVAAELSRRGVAPAHRTEPPAVADAQRARKHVARAKALEESGRLEPAFQEWRQALRAGEPKWMVLLWMGMIRLRQSRLREGVSLLEAAKLQPGFDGLEEPAALPELAWAQQRLGRIGEAEATFKEALANSPNDETVVTSLARFYADSGRLDDSADAFSRALEIEGGGARRMMVEKTVALGVVRSENYRRARDLTLASGARFAAMQYPRLDLDELTLRRTLDDDARVIFIENRANFEAALLSHPFAYFFRDLMHCTAAGDRLVAEQAANALFAAKALP